MISPRVERLSVDQMKALLASSPGNRTLTRAWVNCLVDQMNAGEYESLNGEAIIVDERGRLMDGHHRLTAAVQCGVPREFLVVRGVSRASGVTIDTGKIRTASHILQFNGAPTNSTTTAAVARFLILWLRGFRTFKHSAARVSNRHVCDFVEGHDLTEAVRIARTRSLRGIGGGIVGGFAYLMAMDSPEECEAFWDGVSLGANLTSNDARYRLRELLLRDQRGGLTREPSMVRGLVYKAWLKYRSGETVQAIRWAATDDIMRMPNIPDEWQFGASVAQIAAD